MFNSKHYIPILKWKRAEQNALESLTLEDKKSVTPLVQFVMPKPKFAKDPEKQFNEVVEIFQQKIPKIPEEILKFWGDTEVFVDFSLLYTNPLRIEAVEKMTEAGNKIGLHLVPVLNLSDDDAFKTSVYTVAKKYKSGICLRLVPSDLGDVAKIDEGISKLLKESNLKESDIDLLVDTKEINGNIGTYADASQKISNLSHWRSFIFASGAFPADLSGCKIDEENLIPRLDWKNWVDQIKNKKIVRKPSFADYTIQHPIYRESTQFYHPTTSIKYALEENWLVMKGKKQKFEMYLANAKLLLDDKKRFYGENFSAGDKYIAEKGRHYEKYIRDPKVKGTGSTETWITSGINHHLALVVHQIANLP